MSKYSVSNVILGGLAATLAMSGFAALAPMMGMPPMSPPGMLASAMGAPLLLGWAAHLMIGLMLAAAYSLFALRIPGPTIARGSLFSVGPWLMAQVVVMPMMGAGLFSGSASMAMGSLVGHLVFGTVLTATVRPYCSSACAVPA